MFWPTVVMAGPTRGAGSTFAAPIVTRSVEKYQTAPMDDGDFSSRDWTIDYELVGSLAGLMCLDQPELDFAASDAPVSHKELARHGRQQFPIVLGSMAVAVNLDGIEKDGIKLTGPVLADIYLGKIKSWVDPAIRAVNPDIAFSRPGDRRRHAQGRFGDHLYSSRGICRPSARNGRRPMVRIL